MTTGQTPEVPGEREAPAKRRRRLPTERINMVLAAAAGVLVTVFAFLNLDRVEVNWLVGSGSTPLIVVIAVACLLGAIIGRLSAGRVGRKRR